MKTKTFSKAFALNKRTVVNLNNVEMKELRAGDLVHSLAQTNCPTSVVYVQTADSRLNCAREICSEWQALEKTNIAIK
jgi:hypothetical protein